MLLLRLIWTVVRAPFGLLISVDPAQKDQRTSCPGEHHDFDCMGAILSRIASVDRAAARPQIADIPQVIRRSSFGTLRDVDVL